MNRSAVEEAIDAFLDFHLAFHPTNASFMGIDGYDDRLPRADASAAVAERRCLEDLGRKFDSLPESPSAAERVDVRLARAEIAMALAALECRPRFLNPAWYSGEAIFSIIALLLPRSTPAAAEHVAARLGLIADFLAAGRARLGEPTPRAWVERARREAAAFAEFLLGDLSLHPQWTAAWAQPAAAAATALGEFARAIESLPDASPACGEPHLELLMRLAHGLAQTPRQALREAEAAFDRLTHELTAMAARIDPARPWQRQLDDLSSLHPSRDDVLASYCRWHGRAVEAGSALVTPADDYGLDFRPLDPAWRKIAKALYFLSYRSPPGRRAGTGSVYWVATPTADDAALLRAHNTALVKTVHAVHHGSIGHHTQNARARASRSRLAAIAGTDCASGLAFLSAGTMVEGWACHAVDLLLEAPGFYTPAEALLLKQMERRNAASAMLDIRLHLGEWSLEEAKRFYRDDAGFAPARIEAEVTRNSMFPASRLMYRFGVEAIRSLRSQAKAQLRGSTASRRPSPRKLTASTVTKMHRPGGIASHGAVPSHGVAVFSKLPQVGVGGCTPKPKNDNADSSRIDRPTARVAETAMGPTALGMIWRTMRRALRAPSARAASTYSRSLRLRNWLRTSLAVLIQVSAPMMATRSGTFGRSRPDISSTSGRSGIDSMISVARISTISAISR